MTTQKEQEELDRIRAKLRDKQKEFLGKPDRPDDDAEEPKPPQLGATPGDAVLGRAGLPDERDEDEEDEARKDE